MIRPCQKVWVRTHRRRRTTRPETAYSNRLLARSLEISKETRRNERRRPLGLPFGYEGITE
jgi:hypothetical protein